MIEITMSNSTTYLLHLDKYNVKRGDIAALIRRLGYFHLAPVYLDIFWVMLKYIRIIIQNKGRSIFM